MAVEKNQYRRSHSGNFDQELPLLHLKAMKIQCLDSEMNEIKGAYGTGFVMVEGRNTYLYTCWHVVTGFGFGPARVPRHHVTRAFLRITAQENDGSSVLGGEMHFIVPLYRDKNQRYPDWEQSPIALPHPMINSVNVAVPHSPDVARIKLSDDVILSFMQVFYSDEFNLEIRPLRVLDEVFILGYPYGYSALPESPSALLLPRRIASVSTSNLNLFVLIDQPCASGMSGSPVLINSKGIVQIVGVYSGLIYPDYEKESNNNHTALGKFEDLGFHRNGMLNFVNAGLQTMDVDP